LKEDVFLILILRIHKRSATALSFWQPSRMDAEDLASLIIMKQGYYLL